MTVNPILRRRRLASELRQLRDVSGMTGEQVAEALLISTSKLSRIESGTRTIYPRDVRSLLDLYGVVDEARREALMTLAREGRQRSWWNNYGDLLPGPYLGLEAEASEIRNYQTLLLPGLLQTEEYIRAIIHAGLRADDAEVERRTAARLRRQERFAAGDLEYWAIFDEAALRRPVGGGGVMMRQVEHLIECARRPQVTLQVLPFDAGAYPGMGWPFVILAFPQAADPKVVMVENSTGELYLEGEQETERFTSSFDHLRAAALSPHKTLAMLKSTVGALKES